MTQAIILAAIFAGTMLPLAYVALRESTGRRKGEVRAATAEANATSYATQLADMTNKHREEKQRADRLDDALAQMVASVPVVGAYQRLLQIAAAAKANTGDGAGGVHPSAGSDAGIGDGLLRPGGDR